MDFLRKEAPVAVSATALGVAMLLIVGNVFILNPQTTPEEAAVAGGVMAAPISIPAPVLQSIAPSSAAVGNTVTFNGTGFTAQNNILLNGKYALSLPSSNGTTINVTIPTTVPPGTYSLAVQNANGTSSALALTVTSPRPITPVGTLSVSTDPSSPSYAIESGGMTGGTLGVLRLHASNESINLQQLGLKLTSGNPGDLTQVYIYAGSSINTLGDLPIVPGQLLGTASFVGSATSATSTLVTQVQLPINTDATLVLKGDIANIGTNQPAVEGDLVKVNYQGARGVGAASGATILGGQGDNNVQGVRIFKSFPEVSPGPTLPSTGITDGRLMEFRVTASDAGLVSIGQLKFNIALPAGANLSNVVLQAYTDPGYSTPANGGLVSGVLVASLNAPDTVTITANPAIEVPPGATLYFLLSGKGSYTGSASSYSVTTTLLGDSAAMGVTSWSAASGNNFVWSPNATTTNNTGSGSDWTNGFGVIGLPATGLTQTRTGVGSTNPGVPSLTLTYPTGGQVLSDAPGAPQVMATVTWNSANLGTLPLELQLLSINGAPLKSITNIPNTGSYLLMTDQTIPNGYYKIALYSMDKGPSAASVSTGYIQIINSSLGTAANPSIIVEVPQAGSGYNVNLTPTIGVDWNQSGFIPSNIQIYLIGATSSATPVASLGSPANTFYNLPIPPNTPSGNQYAIEVCDSGTISSVTGKAVCGTSAYFTITGAVSVTPSITYVSQASGSVTINYANLPTNSRILFVNQTTGARYSNASGISGTGSVTFSTSQVPVGSYYLLAQDSNANYLAQTVTFNISH